MTRENDPEATAAFAVLDELGRRHGPDETSVPEPEDDVEEVLRRLYLEAAGLMPYDLEPAALDPALRHWLLAGILGDETQEVASILTGPPAAVIGTAAPAVAALPPAGRTPPAPGARASASAGGGKGRGRRLALAAVLALAVGGLGLWVAYLQSELRSSRARLAWAEREWKEQAISARSALNRLRGRYDLVTAPAVTVFPLRCPTGRGPAANATAYLYVRPQGKQWEFAVHGLEPEPPGRDYQIWFLVGEEPRHAGCFNVRDGRAVISMPAEVPNGVTGAGVSIEPRGGSPRPTSPLILLAERAVRL